MCVWGGGFLLFKTVVGQLLQAAALRWRRSGRFTCSVVRYVLSDADLNQPFAPFDMMKAEGLALRRQSRTSESDVTTAHREMNGNLMLVFISLSSSASLPCSPAAGHDHLVFTPALNLPASAPVHRQCSSRLTAFVPSSLWKLLLNSGSHFVFLKHPCLFLATDQITDFFSLSQFFEKVGDSCVAVKNPVDQQELISPSGTNVIELIHSMTLNELIF